MLEGLLKGLVLWIYGLILEGMQYLSSSLLGVFSLDLTYFETYAPVVGEITNVIIAVGWALLLGNLVFQATRSMAAGLGFEGEDPWILFTRTFVFSLLLMGSRQLCGIGLNFTSKVMELLQIPDRVVITTPEETAFGIDASWLLAMIVGLILIFQIIKFFFEIGERYVVTVILVVLAPLAFGMGGSKNTEDIFKGWCRMFGSMCVMMLMNVVFLKLLLSAMGTVPSGAGVFPWLIFVTAIVRVGRKIDDIVCRMGLNPAHTGSPLGHGFMSLPQMVANNAMRTVMQTAAANKTGSGSSSAGRANPGRPAAASTMPPPAAPSSGGASGPAGASAAANSTSGTSGNQGATAQNSAVRQPQKSGSATPQTGTSASQNTAPTRPPLGRNRTHTPPASASTATAASASTTGNVASGPLSGVESANSSAQSTATAAPAQQGANSARQGDKSAPLNVNTGTPQSATAVGKDGKSMAGQAGGTQSNRSQSGQNTATHRSQSIADGSARSPIRQGASSATNQAGGTAPSRPSAGGSSAPAGELSTTGGQQHPTTAPIRQGGLSSIGGQQHSTSVTQNGGAAPSHQRGGAASTISSIHAETRVPSDSGGTRSEKPAAKGGTEKPIAQQHPTQQPLQAPPSRPIITPNSATSNVDSAREAPQRPPVGAAQNGVLPKPPAPKNPPPPRTGGNP